MRTHGDYRPVELGMRIMEVVRAHVTANPDFMMSEISDVLIERFGISRATCFRHIRTSLDVLCIPYIEGFNRKRFGERIAEGLDRAKACNFPNGKPGPKVTRGSRWTGA